MPAKIINIADHRQPETEAQGFYVPREAARLARLPQSTITYWGNQGIIVPTLTWTNEEGKERDGYSLTDVVYMRLVAILRKRHKMREVVDALVYLTDRIGPPGPNWGNAVVFSSGRDVWADFRDSHWDLTSVTRKGQRAWPEFFSPEFRQLQERADALLVPEAYARHVQVDPGVRNGSPIVRDTTITTGLIRALRLQGSTIVDIADSYPVLNQTKVRQADQFERFLDAA